MATTASCLDGWHLQSEEEWNELFKYLININFDYAYCGKDIAKVIAAKSQWNYTSIIATPENGIVKKQ